MKCRSVELEADCHFDLRCHQVAVSGGRSELPTLDGIDCGLFQLGSKAPINFDIAWQTVGVDNELQYYVSALMSLTCLLRILWIGSISRVGRSDTVRDIALLPTADWNMLLGRQV